MRPSWFLRLNLGYEEGREGEGLALRCFVDVGPLEGDAGAVVETERRVAAYVGGDSV